MEKKIRFNQKDRILICELLEKGENVKSIANKMGCSFQAIYYELKKGCIDGVYNPYYAEEKTLKLQKSKGAKNSIDIDLAQIISDLILKENLSPEKIVLRLQEMHLGKKTPSRNTIYSAIDKGLIPNVTRENLYLHKNDTHLFSNGLLHIPKWIKDELNIQDGDELSIDMIEGKIIIQKK